MDPRLRQRLMGQGQGVDAVPDNLFSQATAAAQSVPQDQQLEAQDETPDTTTDDAAPPVVPPAPDTPPEVAVANSQTNEQADGKQPPTIHMSEDPALRMAGNTQPGGSINPMTPPPMPPPSGQSPPPEPSTGPNYGQLADVARRARGQDAENINRWNLGEGLKEAFAIARGQHYSGRPYGGALEEPAVEKEQADTQKRIQEYLTRKRQGEIDARQGKLVESEIGKNNAEAAKALRPPEAKPVKPEEFNAADYKASMKASPGIVDAIKRKTGAKDDAAVAQYIDGLPNTKDALELVGGKDLENEAQGKRAEGRGITIGIAGAQAGFGKEEATKQADERFKINATKRQVDGLQSAFSRIPWQDIAAGKVGWDSSSVLNFKAQAQAAIDMLARVETGASARENQVQQWKAIISSPSVVSNDKMAAVADGLRQALYDAETENEKRTEGLPVQIGRKVPPVKPPTSGPQKRTITMRFPDGHEEEVDE